MNCTFNPESHLYEVDGHPIPSVTQVMRAVNISYDYSMVGAQTLEHKRQIGVALHAALHFLQEADLDTESLDEAIRPMIDGYKLFIDDTGFKPGGCEVRVWPNVNGMRYGGTLDVVGTIKGEPTLIDFKCSSGSPHHSYGCQTAAYEMGLPRPLVPPFKYRRYSLQPRENGSYNWHEWKEKTDHEVFKWALGITYWKINHGAKPWEEK
jgi:hypothetical protein